MPVDFFTSGSLVNRTYYVGLWLIELPSVSSTSLMESSLTLRVMALILIILPILASWVRDSSFGRTIGQRCKGEFWISQNLLFTAWMVRKANEGLYRRRFRQACHLTRHRHGCCLPNFLAGLLLRESSDAAQPRFVACTWQTSMLFKEHESHQSFTGSVGIKWASRPAVICYLGRSLMQVADSAPHIFIRRMWNSIRCKWCISVARSRAGNP